MGVDLHLEHEDGVRIKDLPDPRGYVNVLVELAAAQPTVCLRFIDPYGDTVFNRLQAPQLRRELEALRESITDSAITELAKRRFGSSWQQDMAQRSLAASAVRAHLAGILNLASECEAEVHTYLKFYGD